jgi:hypothetical protein
MFQNSLNAGAMPNDWKIAHVVPKNKKALNTT